MRSKVVVVLVFMLALTLAGLYRLRQSPQPGVGADGMTAPVSEITPGDSGSQRPRPSDRAESAVPEPPATAATVPSEGFNTPTPSASVPTPALAQTAPSAGGAGTVTAEAWLRSRVLQLRDLGMQEDSSSLQVILSELTNSTPAIRRAALEAAVEFGNREAIPALRQAAAVTEDPREKVAFLDAADYLELPSLTEVRAQIRPRQPGSPLPRRTAP